MVARLGQIALTPETVSRQVQGRRATIKLTRVGFWGGEEGGETVANKSKT